MANNMLIRTSLNPCKYRLALYVRVVLFIVIPSCYLLVNVGGQVEGEVPQINYDSGKFAERFKSTKSEIISISIINVKVSEFLCLWSNHAIKC